MPENNRGPIKSPANCKFTNIYNLFFIDPKDGAKILKNDWSKLKGTLAMKTASDFLEAADNVSSKKGSLPKEKSPTIHSTMATKSKNAQGKKRGRKASEGFWWKVVKIPLTLICLKTYVSM
jgi:hypothetical protein